MQSTMKEAGPVGTGSDQLARSCLTSIDRVALPRGVIAPSGTNP